MDRVFLDANILFSAAYQVESSLRHLWALSNVQLCTSAYAVEEARRNLTTVTQQEALATLVRDCHIIQQIPHQIANIHTIALPEKDRPILLGAIASHATHLITGDVTHFGKYFGRTIEGIHILPPGQYLRSKKKRQ